MINELRIQNFRIQTKQTIEFTEGVTTIIGSSFAGKSTIIKSLKWVTRNEPAGDSVINWDADKAVARILCDNKTVTRIRGKSINTYKLGKKEFTAFGTNVPKEIENLFNMSNINFQGQFDSHYWFSETAGEVSRQLNKIVDLEIIDKTLSNIAGELRKNKMLIDITEDKVKKASERKKELLYVKELDADFTQIEQLKIGYDEKALECSTIAYLLKSIRLYTSTMENALDLASDAKIAISKGDIYKDLTDDKEKLSNLLIQAKSYQKAIDNKPASLKHIKKLKENWETLSGDLETLDDLLETIKDYEDEKCEADKELIQCKKEFKKIVGKECPICKRPMKI